MLPRVIPQLRTTSVFLNVRGLQRSASFHTLSRSVLHPRIAFKNSPYLACVPPCCKHKAPSGFGSPMRGVASSVKNKPGSQTAEQAALNIKEEVSNTAGSVARAIAGANMTIDSVKPIKPLDDSFVCTFIWWFYSGRERLKMCDVRVTICRLESLLLLRARCLSPSWYMV